MAASSENLASIFSATQWPLGAIEPDTAFGDMPQDELRKHLDRVADWVVAYNNQLDAQPGSAQHLRVAPAQAPGETLNLLPDAGPETGEPMDAVLTLFEEAIAPGLTHGSHPSFFAYFTATASGPAVLAETLGAALNVNTMLWRTGPSANELETASLAWLRDWLGLPDNLWGTLTEGGSFSNLQALAAARDRALGPASREKGLTGTSRRLRLYATDLTHSSIDKAVMLLGLGTEAIRRVPMDEAFRMKPEALAEMIAADRATGDLPFCVVATAGTTACTSTDPIDAVADVAAQTGLWLHVDAAHGGPLAMLPEARFLFNGWARADSITLNPHKWLYVPIGCSALYTRHPEALRQSFSLVADYLKTDEDVFNAMDHGIALGRRFNALKLAFSLRYFGRQGFIARMREHVRLARLFATWVDEDPIFTLAAPVPMSTICFYAAPAGFSDEDLNTLNERLLAAVNASGGAFLSPTRLHGRYVIRLVISGMRVREVDIRAAWELLRDCLQDLRADSD